MIEEVARKIDEYGFNRVIVDPVMIAKGGASLLHDESVATLKSCSFRGATRLRRMFRKQKR